MRRELTFWGVLAEFQTGSRAPPADPRLGQVALIYRNNGTLVKKSRREKFLLVKIQWPESRNQSNRYALVYAATISLWIDPLGLAEPRFGRW